MLKTLVLVLLFSCSTNGLLDQNATTLYLLWTIAFCLQTFLQNFLLVFVKESVLIVFDNQVLKIKASDLSDPSHMRQFKLQHLPIIQSVNNINIISVLSKSK